jgi:hypothetical protein
MKQITMKQWEASQAAAYAAAVEGQELDRLEESLNVTDHWYHAAPHECLACGYFCECA